MPDLYGRSAQVTRRSTTGNRNVDECCGKLRPMLSPASADYPPHEREWDEAVLEASRLAWVVHEYDREQVARLVEYLEQTGKVRPVLVALAAMVDVEQPLSELVAWVNERHDTEVQAAARKPWQRDSYPLCLPELDGAPEGTTSPHGTPARYNAGCRGDGCSLARKDYDSYRYRLRQEARDASHTDDADSVSV